MNTLNLNDRSKIESVTMSLRGLEKLVRVLLISFFYFASAYAQDRNEKKVPPPLQTFRAEEDYSYLINKNKFEHTFGQDLKFLRLNSMGSMYMSIGGQYRVRLENYTNRSWTSEDDLYYSQRIALHGNIVLGKKLRVFGEFYHGLTSGENRVLEDDVVDLHQGFLEFIPVKHDPKSISVRLGRQEISFGASRLVGIREGTNMRRSFDMVRAIISYNKSMFNLFYGKELSYNFDAFDNESNILKENDTGTPTIWGIYGQGPSTYDFGRFDLYYIGFHSELSSFNDVVGEETRHSIGIRSNGEIGDFSYNTELIYQFGEIGTNDIQAYNFETDWKYQLVQTNWRPTFGIKLDWSSGDKEAGDGTIGTFNPLFVNPAIYSLAAVNTPANLTSFHPSITVYPIVNFSINIDYALFYRTQKTDGLYAPPRFQSRKAEDNTERHIGDTIGLRLAYKINRNINFDIRSSYFIAGKFIKESGQSKNKFYFAPTLSFKF